jgi:hopene-associated glycosyltransferase HpnB
MAYVLAYLCVTVWIYSICARGGFWLVKNSSQNDREEGPLGVARPDTWPSVMTLIPARNEAATIRQSVSSILGQDYSGRLSVVVIDDDSSDGTGALAAACGPVTVLRNTDLPPGWTGKLWALKQGVAAAEASHPDYILLTDADIVHTPDSVASLVAKATSGNYVLTSLMAKLRCTSFAERCHVPAFVYFFQMLFPFAWVNRTDIDTAAAAGGCMLVRTDALRNAGGIDSIRNALIDDCALAARLKAVGPIWLGLTERVHSIRAYDSFADIKAMVSRSAYAQLKFSSLLLIAATAGMALAFLAPPLLAIFATGLPQILGALAWLIMAVSFVPMLRFYNLSPLWAVALPAIATLYMFYTLTSAYDHLRQRGGAWKGRVHVNAPSLS